jgi:hypothetical protein
VANLYWVYDIRNRSFLSAHESSEDAANAIRKSIAQGGAIANQALSPREPHEYEVVIVTR